MRKSFTIQRRSLGTNACLLFGPIFFCILLFVLQTVTNKLLDQSADLRCGCRCTACCRNERVNGTGRTQRVCRNLTSGYCDRFRGFECEQEERGECGVRYSSQIQAVWCPVPNPSTWPPVIRVPGAASLAPPFGPWKAVPLMYSVGEGYDSSAGGNETVVSAVTAAMFPLPRVNPANLAEAAQQLPALLNVLRNLTDASFTVFNGHLLTAELGLTFANSRFAPWQYYIDSAFINSGTNRQLDTLYIMMPGNTCAQRNMTFGPGLDSDDDRDMSGTYDIVSFLIKFYSFAIPTLPQLLASLNISTAATLNPLLNTVRVACLDVPQWQLPSEAAVDATLYCGWPRGYAYGQAQCYKTPANRTAPSSYPFAYDFGATSGPLGLDAVIEYNKTVRGLGSGDGLLGSGPTDTTYRTPGLLNAAVRGWARSQLGQGWPGSAPSPATAASNTTTSSVQLRNELLALSSMPKPADRLRLDFSSLLGPLFYCWVVQLLLPTMLQQLVYEKEKRLRMMMKMHGLGDGAYWVVTYAWYAALYALYIAVFLIVGGAVGLQYFRRNSWGIQIILYLLFGQCQIAFTFLLSSLFSSSRTAVVCGYLYVLATGLLGYLLLEPLMDAHGDAAWMRWGVCLLPAFALYRGLYELGAYAFLGVYRNSAGMRFADLAAPDNGMWAAWVVMGVEWFVFMVAAWYLEQVVPTGNGAPRHPLFFLRALRRCCCCCWGGGRQAAYIPQQQQQQHDLQQQQQHDPETPPPAAGADSPASSARYRPAAAITGISVATSASGEDGKALVVGGEGPGGKAGVHEGGEGEEGEDVAGEAARVAGLADYGCTPIVACGLRKVFAPFAGGAARQAVRGLSLGVSRGECFGLLGPNGAGKTTAINMLTGLLPPSGGTGIVEGLDIRQHMPSIYKLMGVCPQHDLLWEQLSGREHLRFYGRLKGLVGRELEDAVDAALKSVNLFNAGVGDKLAGKYSGGMKRRLSVAISFIGSPRVVYLDEPSTGLDPASRRNLWDVVRASKEGRAIILTTHSMQEAEQLCDRLGIFVDGRLVCIGNPREITSRYAGFLVFTITVAPEREADARAFVTQLAPNAQLTYAVGGTLKYELPTSEVSLAAVFAAMAEHRERLRVADWAVANATLEEVFIKLASNLGVTSAGH